MPNEFAPYEVALKISSEDESYVLYQALNDYCSTIIRAHPEPGTPIDRDEEALLLAAQSLAQQIHTAWNASENMVSEPDGKHHHEQPL